LKRIRFDWRLFHKKEPLSLDEILPHLGPAVDILCAKEIVSCGCNQHNCKRYLKDKFNRGWYWKGCSHCEESDIALKGEEEKEGRKHCEQPARTTRTVEGGHLSLEGGGGKRKKSDGKGRKMSTSCIEEKGLGMEQAKFLPRKKKEKTAPPEGKSLQERRKKKPKEQHKERVFGLIVRPPPHTKAFPFRVKRRREHPSKTKGPSRESVKPIIPKEEPSSRRNVDATEEKERKVAKKRKGEIGSC